MESLYGFQVINSASVCLSMPCEFLSVESGDLLDVSPQFRTRYFVKLALTCMLVWSRRLLRLLLMNCISALSDLALALVCNGLATTSHLFISLVYIHILSQRGLLTDGTISPMPGLYI